MSTIFHIATREDWDAAQTRGSYAPASLGAEGFVHCSTATQVESTANAFYRGRSDLLLLSLDDERLTSELRYEAPTPVVHEGGGELFPHLYGALNLDAVTAVEPMTPGTDGGFANLVPNR